MNGRVEFLDLPAIHAPAIDELDAVWHEVVRNATFIGGAEVGAFEREWAAYCGVDHAVGVANGTDAIELVLRALGIGAGDEVIVPTNTFIATAAAVVAAGATPVFVDVDPGSMLAAADHIAAAVGPRTAAVVYVHLHGTMGEMSRIVDVCERAGLALVEDAAQAHGATHRGRPAGSWGVAGTFSFYPGKNLGAFGDGGAVVTDDPVLAARIRQLGDHGRSPNDRYVHAEVGRNSRLDGLQAAVLRIKLRRLDEWNGARRRLAAVYREHLPAGATTRQIPDGSVSVHHVFAVEVDDRDRVAAELTDAGVGVGVHYPVPCHRQPAFAHLGRAVLPVAERAAASTLSLPMHPLLRSSDVVRVAELLGQATRA